VNFIKGGGRPPLFPSFLSCFFPSSTLCIHPYIPSEGKNGKPNFLEEEALPAGKERRKAEKRLVLSRERKTDRKKERKKVRKKERKKEEALRREIPHLPSHANIQ